MVQTEQTSKTHQTDVKVTCLLYSAVSCRPRRSHNGHLGAADTQTRGLFKSREEWFGAYGAAAIGRFQEGRPECSQWGREIAEMGRANGQPVGVQSFTRERCKTQRRRQIPLRGRQING
ncbi:hypothetical protein GBF38_005988 [Nibea albiflora]|uniref:Uncharacterized protein n=1 Tax=Nibea albiflora TaxID=240163 RepID=A0ACB7FAR2_NIBAL|nr:hypothetical protein GBF38_005988 [Nibea albiflora]